MAISKNKIITLVLLALVLIISSAIIFNKLGATTIWDWDEARRAENALEILKTGEWVVLQYGGKPDMWNVKGPLPAWLIAISFKIFGPNEFALRLWPALFGVGTIAIVYLFGLDIKNRYVGLYAALILLTAKGFTGYHGARTGDCDVMVTFFLTLSLYLFYLGQRKKNLAIPIGAAASMALGFLVKGLILIVPVITALYLLYFKSFKKTVFSRETKYAVSAFFAVALPWIILRFIRGRDFFVRKFQFDIFERFTKPIEGHFGPWYYYFNALHERGMHWILLILLSIAFIYSLFLFRKKDKPATFLIIWISLYFLIISFIQTKIFWYLMPIYPALSLLIAYNIEVLQELLRFKRMVVLPLFLLIMILPVTSITGYTEKVIISPRVQAVKGIKEDLGKINDIYIHENENSQSIFFYLHTYIKGDINLYKNPSNLRLKKGDGIITFDRHRLNTLGKDQGYQAIIKSGRVGLLGKF
ncbi:MAG: glycosyltransferase family 39 protein [Candidatus Omnitrophica bacterium]|nr:glycosyltransferase family 39 protein [Candidatus Omnitrophota bacterium]